VRTARTVVVLSIVLLAGVAGLGGGGAAPSETEDAIQAFLGTHWSRPVPSQGPPPPAFKSIEASLAAKDCGVCHPAQFADWRASVHAKAMGAGVMGQLVDMIHEDRASARGCQTCHAPLAEQMEQVESRDAAGRVGFAGNPDFSRSLQGEGVACPVCHVRAWERFGPPRRDGSPDPATPRSALPHHGATRTAAFLRSEFCKPCHQFGADGYSLNGKLLENTYEEWRQSPYARQGVQCQDCHMPDRRHLWRGIHDPGMVGSGVLIQLDLAKPKHRVGEQVDAVLSVASRAVGHLFPTYLTPKVFLGIELVDAGGHVVPGTRQEAVIGRAAALDLSRELYDTRLAPGETFTMRYSRKVDRAGLTLRARVVVEPDHFCAKFFEAVIPRAHRGRRQLEVALQQARRSAFTIFSKEVKLD
jgi:hypothetical protein